MQVIWYTAMSMDGRVAGAGDNLSFLEHIDTGTDGSGEFESFASSVDAVLVGGTTMRWLFEQGVDLPLTGKPVWVLTRSSSVASRVTAAATDDTPVHVLSGDIGEVLASIEASGCSRLWLCGGGVVAGSLLAIDGVDEVIAAVAPVALGSGPALFEASDLPLHDFTLAECRPFGNAARLRWVRERHSA